MDLLSDADQVSRIWLAVAVLLGVCSTLLGVVVGWKLGTSSKVFDQIIREETGKGRVQGYVRPVDVGGMIDLRTEAEKAEYGESDKFDRDE